MAEIQEFKGNKLLCLNPGGKFPFSFGLFKAKLILENMDAIKKFVDSEGKVIKESENKPIVTDDLDF